MVKRRSKNDLTFRMHGHDVAEGEKTKILLVLVCALDEHAQLLNAQPNDWQMLHQPDGACNNKLRPKRQKDKKAPLHVLMHS